MFLFFLRSRIQRIRPVIDLQRIIQTVAVSIKFIQGRAVFDFLAVKKGVPVGIDLA